MKNTACLALLALCTTQLATTAAQDVKPITSEDEFNTVYKSNKPLALKFQAPWCGACTDMSPAYNKVAEETSNIRFYDVNVSEENLKPLIKKHKIEGLPTVIFVKDGKEVRRERGCMTEQDFSQSVKRFSATFKKRSSHA